MGTAMDSTLEKGGLKYFYIIYDIAFIFLTIVPTWFLPFSVIDIVEADIFLICVILSVLFLFHHENTNVLGFSGWALLFAAGLVFIALAMQAEPAWWEFGVKIFKFGFISTIRELGNMLPSNPLLFVGLSICYCAVIGFMRELLLRLIERRRNNAMQG